MRRLFIILVSAFALFNCNYSKKTDVNYISFSDKKIKVVTSKTTKSQLESFDDKLTADTFFWQSFNNKKDGRYLIDYLFAKDGSVTAFSNGRANFKDTGTWIFDKLKGTLQISWENSKQYIVEVKEIKPDWSEISFSGQIYEYGSNKIRKMNLLNRNHYN